MPFCLAQVPNCNDPSKFSDRQVYANSVDPYQTPVPSGFTMFAILSASLCHQKVGTYWFRLVRMCISVCVCLCVFMFEISS